MADEDPQGMLPDLPPKPAPKPELSLVVPDAAHLLQMRERAREAEELPGLRKLVAAWQAAAEKCDVAFEEMTRLAIYRLEVERDLGAHLAQTVHRGGDRSNCPGGSLPRKGLLPDDVTWKQSAAYQRLAAIPPDVFQAYLKAAHDKRVVPSSAGARAFANPPGTGSPAAKAARRPAAAPVNWGDLPAAVLACVENVMTPDFVVGRAKIPAKNHVEAADPDQLRGDVFVAQCDDPARWLTGLEDGRCGARINRAIIVLPATPWEAWFGLLERGDWLVCLLRDARDEAGNGVALAHIGARPSVFRIAFRSLGVVLRAASPE